MASVNDWAAKAAQRILVEYESKSPYDKRDSEAHVAAIIATFAEPLVAMLRESHREHYHSNDSWYCCGQCTHECDNEEMDHEHDESCCVGSNSQRPEKCNCGVSAWNAKIDKVLGGELNG